MDWLRWHHGTVDDRKFPGIARRAGASVAEVIALWACLLEAASTNADRGLVLLSSSDLEDLDSALGLADGRAEAVYVAMVERGVIVDGRLTAWDKRQPKRERDEVPGASTERVRKHREGKRETAESRDETPRNATQHPEQPRGEERRLDNSTPSDKDSPHVPPAADAHARPAVVDMAIDLNTAGFRCTPRNPDLLAYVDEGGDRMHLAAIAADPKCTGKAAGYVIAFARRELATKPAELVVVDAAPMVVHARAGPAMSKTAQGIASLEGLKSGNQLAAGRNRDGAAEARDVLPGSHTRLRIAGGYGDDVG